ncbi:MAG: hypothetical protein V3R16_08895 [Nitrospirales bacterium]
MGKNLGGSLAGPDDPIFKEGPTFYTRKSDRASTPSTPILPSEPDKSTAPASSKKKPSNSRPASQER